MRRNRTPTRLRPSASSATPRDAICFCAARSSPTRGSARPSAGSSTPRSAKARSAARSAGESPLRCAQREIEEEAGLAIPEERLSLVGIISEHGYDGTTNWLMFWYRVLLPVELREHTMREGDLIWRHWHEFDTLALPETDQKILWPLVRAHEKPGAFFSVHIECEGKELAWRVQESRGAG